MLLFNGKIYTQDPDQTWVDCLLIDRGKIVAAGTYAQVAPLANPSHEQVDLHHRLVLPGFVDSHLHLELYAEFLANVDCETLSRDECVHRIAIKADNAPVGQWIVGHGWNHNIWPEGLGNKEILDAVTGDHPAYFTSKSVHSGWANSTALRIAGITSSTPDPDGGVILRNKLGEPTGILLETAMQLVEKVIPTHQPDATIQNISAALEQLAKYGITGVHDFDGVSCLSALQSLQQTDHLKIRVVKGIPFSYLDEACRLGLSTGFGTDILQIGALKLFSDGALGPQTAYMLDPYEKTTDSFGISLLSEKEIVDIGYQAISHHIAVATHAIGDHANRIVNLAYGKIRKMEKQLSLVPLNHRIEHVQLIDPEDRRCMQQNRIIASMQPVHATSDWKMADRYWGTRVDNSYAWKSILDLDIPMIFGSDAPVESPNPMLGLHAAITRKGTDCVDSNGWIPTQKITMEQAITAYTETPAYAANQSHQLGKLKSGYLADLVVMDSDIFTCPIEQLRSTGCLATMVAGQWIWKAE